MFNFSDSPAPVRTDVRDAFRSAWRYFAGPGPVLDAHQRNHLLREARSPSTTDDRDTSVTGPLLELGRVLYGDPSGVDGALVRSATDSTGNPATVEAIGIVAMLAAIDGTHRALGVELEALPEPQSGEPTGRVATGLRRRRSHVPMPKGGIPTALDLVPDVGRAYRAMFGPLYMTLDEMESPTFARNPGLGRAQMEMISSRTSLINECFY